MIRTMKNNVLDGPPIMYYYDNGARKAEAEYKEGVLHGTSTAWSKDGAVERTAKFEEGRVVSPEGGAAGKSPR